MRRGLLLTMGLAVFGLSVWGVGRNAGPELASRATAAEANKADASGAKPVEDSMHEFMEYVFQPNYKRLKVIMAAEPADNAGWKAIKGDALSLAEACNLLLIRVPEDDGDDWKRLSVAARDAGGAFYQAARAKDYKAAFAAYATMLTKCNACHDQFAGGEHQLTP